MAQHDYVIANGTGAAVRSDLNNALAAIVSQNSGATEPATTYAYQWWADTTTNLLKLRNSANSGWITLFQLDGEWSTIALENGTAGAPSIYFKDSGTDTGFYSPAANKVGISTGGTLGLIVDDSQRVGIGTSSPQKKAHFAISSGTGLLANYDGLLLQNETSAVGSTVGIGFACGNLSEGATAGITAIQKETTQKAAHLAFFTRHDASGGSTAERMRIDSAGNVGIGTTSPTTVLDINTASGASQLRFSNGTYYGYVGIDSAFAGNDYSAPSGGHRFRIGGSFTEAARIDSSGRLLVGTSTYAQTNTYSSNSKFNIAGDQSTGVQIQTYSNNASGMGIDFSKSRGSTVGTNTIVQSGDAIGNIIFNGYDGSSYLQAAYILAQVDGTPGTNDMPGRLVFSTTADGASSPTERMRITNNGVIYTGNTSSGASTTAGVIAAIGYASRSGTAGSFNTNVFNMHWTGSPALYVDSTNLGNIQLSSDYRIKKNVQTIDSPCIERIKNLRPITYELANYGDLFKEDGVTREGFIAHEVQQVIPSGAEGEKDEENRIQNLRVDAIVAVLTKALQEAVEKIETLEAKVAALEAQ